MMQSPATKPSRKLKSPLIRPSIQPGAPCAGLSSVPPLAAASPAIAWLRGARRWGLSTSSPTDCATGRSRPGILFPHLQKLGHLHVGPGSRLLDDDAQNVSEIALEHAELLQPGYVVEDLLEVLIQKVKVFVDGQPVDGFHEAARFT